MSRSTPRVSLPLAALAAALALAPDALAQGGHDLRRIVGRKPAVGERTRVTQEETGSMVQTMGRAGQPGRTQKQEKHPQCAYVEEVQAVGKDGLPTRVLRTYEVFKDDQGTEVAVEGVVVQLTRDDATGKHAFAAAEGSKPLPPAIEADLRGDQEGKNQRAEKGISEEALYAVLFPAEPQAAGATWTIDVAQAAPLLGMEVEDLDVPTSKTTGTLKAVEEAEGRSWVVLELSLTLMVKRMQGQPLPAPTPMELTLGFRLPAAGDAPDGQIDVITHFALDMAGPQGMTVSLKIDSARHEVRARAP